MKTMKRAFLSVLAAMLMIISVSVFTHEHDSFEISDEEPYLAEDNIIDNTIPSLEIVEESDGTYTVTVLDASGNVIAVHERLVGTVEEVIEQVYNTLIGRQVRCSHIPFAHDQVWGGINHIIGPTQCTMVRTLFWQCRE